MAQQTIQIADKPTLDNVKALLENSGYGLEALHSLISTSGGGVVKSVQRGILGESNGRDVSITISTVDPDKCLVIIDEGTEYNPSNDDRLLYPYIRGLTSDTLSLARGGIKQGYYFFSHAMSWQVIEFY